MCANLTPNSSHGGHGVYGGHGGICKFLLSPWSLYLRVLRVMSFIVMLALIGLDNKKKQVNI